MMPKHHFEEETEQNAWQAGYDAALPLLGDEINNPISRWATGPLIEVMGAERPAELRALMDQEHKRDDLTEEHKRAWAAGAIIAAWERSPKAQRPAEKSTTLSRNTFTDRPNA